MLGCGDADVCVDERATDGMNPIPQMMEAVLADGAGFRCSCASVGFQQKRESVFF
jgi:hypothetical protein